MQYSSMKQFPLSRCQLRRRIPRMSGSSCSLSLVACWSCRISSAASVSCPVLRTVASSRQIRRLLVDNGDNGFVFPFRWRCRWRWRCSWFSWRIQWLVCRMLCRPCSWLHCNWLLRLVLSIFDIVRRGKASEPDLSAFQYSPVSGIQPNDWIMTHYNQLMTNI